MYPDNAGAPRKPRFFYGWLVVLVGFLGDFMMAGISTHSFSFFIKPMTQELGWTRTMITGAATLRTLTGAITGPIIGPLIDRYGGRVVMIGGALLAGAGIMLLSQVSKLWQFYLVYGVMGAEGLTAMGGLVVTSVVAKWFIRKRGRAMAFVAAGLPLGGVVLGPISQFMIQHFSWREAWMVLGGLVWIIIIPAAWLFMRRTPEDMGLLPDGDEGSPVPRQRASDVVRPAEVRSAPQVETIWTLKAALRTPALWVVLLSFILSGMGLSGTMLHQTAYISDKGLPTAVMTTNMVIWGLSATLGTLFWGFLAERFPARYIVSAAFFLGAVGLSLLVNAQSLSSVLLYAVTFGFAAGASAPMNALILANYYGRTFVGAIQGATMPFRLISTAGGPLFAGYIYDVTGSYNIAFSLFAGTYLLGALMILTAKPPIFKEKAAVSHA